MRRLRYSERVGLAGVISDNEAFVKVAHFAFAALKEIPELK
jgi:hypothetical protein